MQVQDEIDRGRGPAGAGLELRARREGIAQTLLNVLLPVGLLAYVPGVWLAVQEEVWMVVVLDTVAYLAVVYAWFLPRHRYRLRGAILVGGVYLLGTVLCLTLGVISAGPLWLAATPLLAAIFFEIRETMMALVATIVAAVLITVPLATGMVEWPSTEASVGLWVMMAGNLIAVASILSVAVASLLEGMLASAQAAERIGGQLAAERTRLVETNARLRHEMEERRQAEAMLRQSEKLTAIGTLAGGIAHDFNNLLTAIGGYARMILDALPDDDPLRNDAREVIGAGERGATLVRQLMAFSRRQVVRPDVLSLNDVVAAMERMLGRLLREDMELITALDPGVGPIRADRSQIEQVLLNLVVNARDAMPDGGLLKITTAPGVAGEGVLAGRSDIRPGRHAVLAVTDTGHGIQPEVADRIFEPFFTTKGEGKGTGLGLSTVYGIVEQNGGSVWVESEPDAGATFYVCLPEADAVPAGAEEQVAVYVERGSETVLLVEDQVSVRVLARRVLERSGYRVLEATTGPEALELIEGKEGSIDLLLTDVVMPRMSGRELAERLQKIRPGIPVLYMSGYAEDEIAHRGVLEPGTHLVQKPFTPQELAVRVRALLDAAAEPSRSSSAPPDTH